MWKRKEGMEGRMGKKIPKVNGRADGKNNTKSDPLDHRKSKRIPEKKSTSASFNTLMPLTV